MTELRAQLERALGGAYTIERELGGGGMSRVFLAEESALGRTVVVKVLPPELTGDVSIDRFKREIQVAARLQHAHIVPVLTAGETDGLPYYTMPFVEGESLRARLDRAGALPIVEAVSVLRDVARALKYAHERGIVHRDIKPDNVMLADGSAVVTDFGIAKAISASRTNPATTTLTQAGMALGTPAYMAPEQAAGDPATDHRADLYAFGCLAYEMLAGKRPFTEASPHQLLVAHMTKPAEPVTLHRAETPAPLAALVARCLEKDPADRPGSAAELLRALDGVSGEPAPAVIRRTSPDSPRRRITPPAAWAAGGLIAIAAGIMLMRALGIGPVASLLAAGKFSAKEAVLVTDFTVINADSSLGRVLSDATKATLAQSSVITLLPPAAVGAALVRMERPRTSRLDLPLAQDLANRNGIKAIVDGQINGLGSGGGYIVTVRLVTADSLKELASFRRTADNAQGLIDVIDKLSRQLRGRVGESLKDVRAAPSLARVTTSSLEALEKYTEADRAEALEVNRPRAMDLLREAVAIDSTFAEAWRKLAMIETVGGASTESADSAFRQAYRYRDRVPEVERRFIEGSYFSLGPGRDRSKAVAAYEEALRLGDTIRTAYNLGMRYVSRREFAKAESLFRAGQRVGAFDDRARGLAPARALAFEGKYAAADTVYAEALRRFPNWRLPKLYRLDLLYLRGDTGAFRLAVDSVATHGDSVARDWASQKTIQLALLDGRERNAARSYAAANASLGRPSPNQRLARLVDPVAQEMRLRMQHDRAALARELDAALVEAPLASGTEAERLYFPVALAYAHAGRADRARAVLAKYDAEVKDTALRRSQLPERQNVLGEILLAENKPLDATVEFRKSDRLPDGPAHECTVCLPFALARAFDRAGVTDSAIVYYEQFLTAPFPDRLVTWMDPLYRPRFTKRLGELYESRGDVAKAADWYRRFLALWQHADPELQPEVQDSRERLRRLADLEGRAR
jgi:eukaryotic-like serine/threonine-protein kinase